MVVALSASQMLRRKRRAMAHARLGS